MTGCVLVLVHGGVSLLAQLTNDETQMPRHFSLPSVLRMVSNDLLQPFFERLNIALKCMDWKKLPGRNADPLLIALSWESLEDQVLAESALRDVFELACRSGREALAEAATHLGMDFEWPDRGDYYCSMWVWLHHPAVFRRAHLVHQTTRAGRWRRRHDLSCVEPQTSPEALTEFNTRLCEFLKQHQGRGHQCTIQHFCRMDRTHYFVAWPDDFVQTIHRHDAAGQLRRDSLRRTFEMVFAYTPEEGTLDLYANLPSHLKPELECLFSNVLLLQPLDMTRNGQSYDLNQLKRFRTGFPTSPRDQVQVRMTRMRLSDSSKDRDLFVCVRRRIADDIFQASDELLNPFQQPLDDLEITMATLAFDFQAPNEAGVMTFDLWPDSSNLRNQPKAWATLAQQYLKQWEIHRG